MHGDLSRVTFDPLRRFSAVVHQQGRVSLDADHNEQTAIVQHHLRTLTVDLLGRRAWPAAGAGFEIELVPDGLSIGAGRCWIDGMLVENPAPARLHDQPDAHFDRDLHQLPAGAPFFAYLDVWERLVTSVEEPALRDVALDGPDTSARTKIVWQVRVAEPSDGARQLAAAATAGEALGHWQADVEPGLLGSAPATLVAGVDDGGYRGAANALYRVEIHAPGGPDGEPPPAFTWSRDNGSVVFAVLRREEHVVVVAGLEREGRRALHPGDVVELVDDASVLDREPAALRRVADVDHTGARVVLDADPPEATGSDPNLHPLLRRWDGGPADAGPGPIALEHGIEVAFEPGHLRAGDYWTFPARVGTRDVEWPRIGDLPRPRRPDGIRRSLAPLAYVQGSEVMDLRTLVAPRDPA